MANTYSAIERNKKPAGALEIPEDFKFYYLISTAHQRLFADSNGYWRVDATPAPKNRL